MLSIDNSLILPHISFKLLLELLLKKSTRSFNSAWCNADTAPFFKLYNLLRVEDIYKFRLPIFYHNLIYDKAPQHLKKSNNSGGLNYYLIKNLRWPPPMHFHAFIAGTCRYKLPIMLLYDLNSNDIMSEVIKIINNVNLLGFKRIAKTIFEYIFVYK